jgi:hypothetical protein
MHRVVRQIYVLPESVLRRKVPLVQPAFEWFAAHASDELAAEALLEQFKRAVREELELLEVHALRQW